MKLMTWLGLTLVFSMPARAIYVDGGIQCYPNAPTHVNGDAETILDFWDVWDGWGPASAYVAISGPASGSALASADWEAFAYVEIMPAPPGTYQFAAVHGAYYYGGFSNSWYELYYYESSCDNGAVVPSLTVNPTQSDAVDGDNTVTFDAVTTNIASPAYQWTYTAPMFAGNGPYVVFGSPNSASTSVNSNWFANPNSTCEAESSSTYTVTATVTFNNQSLQASALHTVHLLDVSGRVNPNDLGFDGFPQVSNMYGYWQVVGPGNLTRHVPEIHLYVPSTSQFYNKTLAHEENHQAKFAAGGIFGNFMQVEELMPHFVGIFAADEAELDDLILQQIDLYRGAVFNDMAPLYDPNSLEAAAYAVSDPIPPQYFYQGACNGY